jgi:hypothetical protein
MTAAGVGDFTALPRPVFLLGVTQRTGTHLLEGLLEIHPECCVVGPRPVAEYWSFEDFLLEHADLLERYVQETRRHWVWPWGSDHTVDDVLLAGLGTGLLNAFASLGKTPTGSIGLLRTPNVSNLTLVPKLFPDAQVIVVVRDPLDVAASGQRSFGPAFRSNWNDAETWIYRWQAGVQALFAAYEELGGRRLHSVRFEDLVEDRDRVVRMLLRFLDLEAGDYDFERAASLPVRGSSEVRASSESVDWEPVAASEGFDPVGRSDVLPAAQRRRLSALVENEMKVLGYGGDVELGAEDRLRAAVSRTGLRAEQWILDRARRLRRRGR